MIDFDLKAERIKEVFYLLISKGTDAYYGEEITQLEHALQAAHFARMHTDNEDVILAALLHDIGHLLETNEPESHSDHSLLGNQDHDRIGAEYLRQFGFRQSLLELVENHVQTKRYLVSTDPGYSSKLSEASKQTLHLQDGPMWPEEIALFEAQNNFDEVILIRMCDEFAKVPGMRVDGLEVYRDMLYRHLI